MTAYLALGLMSGTSMDGVDAALITTDGEAVLDRGPWLTMPYPDDFRCRLKSVLGRRSDEDGLVAEVARELSVHHLNAIFALLRKADLAPDAVDVIGFHGHTICHAPEDRFTWQIGYGEMLSEATGIQVVEGLRVQDVAAGGQGAPLVPVYHQALAADLPRPLAILNLGGVANVTWLGGRADDMLAFDCGPANAPVDDWVFRLTGKTCDEGGQLAASGEVDMEALARLLDNPYFDLAPPKSLDRDQFDLGPVDGLSAADGAATLTAFSAASVGLAARHFPAPVSRWLVCGGGRHNPTLMAMIKDATGADVQPVEAVGWEGDAIEAQAFGFLAVRHLRGLPITFPGTTGAPRPLTGGRIHQPKLA